MITTDAKYFFEYANRKPVYVKGMASDYGPYFIENIEASYSSFDPRENSITYTLIKPTTQMRRTCKESDICNEEEHWERFENGFKVWRTHEGLKGYRLNNDSSTYIDETPMINIDFKPFDYDEIWKRRCVELAAQFGVKETTNMKIKKIIFSGPCTIVLWKDGTKTMARVSEEDIFDPEKGVAICFMKKILGHTEANKILRKAYKQYWDE